MAQSTRATVLLFLILMTLPLQVAAQENADEETPLPPLTLAITSSSAEAFPLITAEITVREGNQTAIGLTADNFTVNEPAENLTITPVFNRSIATIFVVDASIGSDIDLIQNTLLAYVDTVYQEGDTLILLIVTGAAPQRIEASDTTQIRTAIRALEEGEDSFNVNNTLQTAFLELQTIARTNPEMARQAVVIGSYLFALVTETAGQFADQDIPLHVIQAHRDRLRSTADYQDMARTGGGLFAENPNGQYSPAIEDGSYTTIGELAQLYQVINNNRLSYQLAYRSQNQNTVPTRPVRITITTPDGREAVNSFVYNPVFQAPEIEIIAPTNVTPTLRFDEDGSLEPAQETITVQVTFPDGVARPIQRVRLEVTDPVTGEPHQLPFELSPAETDANGSLLIPWNLTAYSQPATTTDAMLTITVTDELGLSSSTFQQGNVTVSELPTSSAAALATTIAQLPTTTPVPTFTEPPTFTPQPTFTQPPSSTPAPTFTEPPTFTPQPTFTQPPTFTPQFTFTPQPTFTPPPTDTPAAIVTPPSSIVPDAPQDVDRLIIGLLAITVIVMGIAILFLRNTSLGQQIVEQGSQIVQTSVYRVRTEIFGTGPDLAPSKNGDTGRNEPYFGELRVLRGPEDLQTIAINRPRFIVGREIAAGCNFAITSPFVSSQHFTIFQKENGFTLIDMNTSNGTRLDGDLLRPNLEYPLVDGAIIEITTELALQFHAAESDKIAESLELAAKAPPSRLRIDPSFWEGKREIKEAPGQNVENERTAQGPRPPHSEREKKDKPKPSPDWNPFGNRDRND